MALDYQVMGHAFKIHSRLGTLCDERIYADELAYRCGLDGLDAIREPHIKVTHQAFSKSYFLDLLIDGKAVYELKVSKELSPKHEQQLLNYLLLANLKHGKLITFGGESVQHRFVSTKLNSVKRHQMGVDTKEWKAVCKRGERLPDIVTALLEDWGGFLSVNLYREAISFILSDGNGLKGQVQILDTGRLIGKQVALLFAPDVVFYVSGCSRDTDGLRKHLKRLLENSSAQVIQWLNFDHHAARIETLEK